MVPVVSSPSESRVTPGFLMLSQALYNYQIWRAHLNTAVGLEP